MTNDYSFGLLIGEIVWLRHLSKQTENEMLDKMCTPEERGMYESLDEIWFYKVNHLRLSTEETKDEWKAFRDYRHSLLVKYLQHEIEYDTWVHFKIEDMEQFYRGIKNYIWNTDHSCYDIEKENILIENDTYTRLNPRTFLKIKFYLDKYEL